MATERSNPKPARRPLVRPGARRSPGRPHAADGAETQANILQAARGCFAREGFDKTTNRDIADDAGITAGTIYHYFPSKPALFVAVGDVVASTFFARFRDVVGEGPVPFRTQARHLVELVRTLSDEDPTLVAFMAVWAIEVTRHEEIRGLVGGDGLGDPVAFYRERAEQAVAEGQLARGTDATAVAGMITSLLFGLALLVQAGHGPDLVGPSCEALDRLLQGELFT
jgi:AcrR family transcriptional regulator